MYAALAPSPQTSVHLKAACRTWTDHLWAQVSVVCEEKESAELNRLTESFWEGSGPTDVGIDEVNEDVEDVEEEEWEKEVVSSLESLSDVAVEEGYVFATFSVEPTPHSSSEHQRIALIMCRNCILSWTGQASY